MACALEIRPNILLLYRSDFKSILRRIDFYGIEAIHWLLIKFKCLSRKFGNNGLLLVVGNLITCRCGCIQCTIEGTSACVSSRFSKQMVEEDFKSSFYAFDSLDYVSIFFFFFFFFFFFAHCLLPSNLCSFSLSVCLSVCLCFAFIVSVFLVCFLLLSLS